MSIFLSAVSDGTLAQHGREFKTGLLDPGNGLVVHDLEDIRLTFLAEYRAP